MGGGSPWRAGSKVLQYLENTGVLRHVVGHGTALTDHTVFPQEDATVTISDHRPERSDSSGVNRSASSIEPGKVIIAHRRLLPLGREEGGESPELGGG